MRVLLLLAFGIPLAVAQDGTIPVAWDPVTVEGVTGYEIYIQTGPGPYPCSAFGGARVIPVGTEDTEHIVTGLQDSTEHWIMIKAVGDDNQSQDCSNIIHGWPSPRVDRIIRGEREDVGNGRTQREFRYLGANFKPSSTVYSFQSAGPVRMVEYERVGDGELRVIFEYPSDIRKPIQTFISNTDSTSPTGDPCDPANDFANCVVVEAGTLET